jgi:hypothetical protein
MENNNSLTQHLSLKDCFALNAEGNADIRTVFGSGGVVKSNKDDPELIIIVKFLSNVNISGIKILGGMNQDFHPQNMQIFANNGSLSFSDIGTVKATEAFNMESNFAKTLPLKVAKFRNISTIAVIFAKIDILFE